MKLIVLNKKRLGVTIIIIGLMVVLFGFQAKFDSIIKQTALIQSNIYSLKEYSALKNAITYKLPSDWTTSSQSFVGKEILYHNDFQSPDAKIHGFVEIWSINEDLKTFLDKSKIASETQNVIKDYSIAPISINGKSGYEVQYVMITDYGVPYKAFEYFINDQGKFIRFSFFVRNANVKENMSTIFKTIVDTIKYNY